MVVYRLLLSTDQDANNPKLQTAPGIGSCEVLFATWVLATGGQIWRIDAGDGGEFAGQHGPAATTLRGRPWVLMKPDGSSDFAPRYYLTPELRTE